jgi:hypothetical protein
MTDANAETLYGRDELGALVTDEDVFAGVFACLRRIWSPPEAIEDRNLAGSEYRTRLLEREVAAQYPPLYDELAARMGDHPVTTLESGCGVIMDALSLREGFQFARDLSEEYDWEVSLSWAPVECLPTKTEFVCRAWFDAPNPSSVSREDYQYIGDMSVPALPGTNPEYVWTRNPDERLESAMKGNYSTEELTDIYADVRELLEAIIAESTHEKFLVTSDHGYVNHLGNNPYLPLSEDIKAALSGKFSGRNRKIANGQAFELLEDAGVIDHTDTQYVVKGHNAWTKRGATSRIMHGGFSLPECMTPVLRINTNGDTQS